jgi:hypothetical protein
MHTTCIMVLEDTAMDLRGPALSFDRDGSGLTFLGTGTVYNGDKMWPSIYNEQCI